MHLLTESNFMVWSPQSIPFKYVQTERERDTHSMINYLHAWSALLDKRFPLPYELNWQYGLDGGL